MKQDNEKTIDFLRRWAPEGPWVLTAICVNKKGIETRTFYPKTEDALLKWINEYNGKRNLYFHVNSPMRDLTKKADREDILSVDWFHIDIDPRAGEDLDAERKRALDVLTNNLPDGVPKPTVIIFSGGGYQAFWKLEDPIKIDGDLPKGEDAKRYNVQLELRFGADNCHNIDRIMRLPNTMNIPDARKIKKGRVPTLAVCVQFDDVAYPLSAFIAAQSVQRQGETIFDSNASQIVTISGNIDRIDSTDELDEWGVEERIKVIMGQGKHPDEPKKGDNSRSAWLFDFVCGTLRRGVPDDVIFAIITDSAWGISESVLEKKGHIEKYAIKQIESAKFHAIDPWLHKFNNKYAVVQNYGGKCLVISDQHDHSLDRKRLTRQTFNTFKDAYNNKRVQIGTDKFNNPKYMPAGKWWLENEHRRQYSAIAFAPEVTLPDDVYNLWRGFSVTSVPGECGLFLDHVRENVCGGNEVYYEYLLNWMARAVKHPERPGLVAIVLRGGRGVGKSFFAHTFGKLFGRHYMQISNSGHLVGNFNSHLRDLVVLFADEAFFAGDKKHESILKTLVTEEQMAIEAKGIDVEMAPNCIHLIMASNDLHVIPAGGDERRFFMVDVGDAKKQNIDYFRAITEQMERKIDKDGKESTDKKDENSGYKALLNYLRTMDIEDFEVRHVPNTPALREQKLLSLSVVEEWWYQKLLNGCTITNGDEWQTDLPVEHLVNDYVAEVKRFNITKRGNATAMGRFLSKVCPCITTSSRKTSYEIQEEHYSRWVHRRARWYHLPPLEKARSLWEEQYGKTDWDSVIEDESPNEGG
jgi:hypothetical protein